MKKLLVTLLCLFMSFNSISYKVNAEENEVVNNENTEVTEVVGDNESSELLTLGEIPTLSLDKDIYYAFVGSSDVVTITANEIDEATYKWFKDGVEINGETTSTYTLTNEDKAAYGKFVIKCEATFEVDETPQKVEDTATVFIVNQLTIEVDQKKLNLVKGSNENITISTAITGEYSDEMPITYKWYKDDVEIVGEDNSSYTLTEADKANYGVYKYKCELSYAESKVETSKATVNVTTAKTPLFSDVSFKDTSITDKYETYGYKYIVSDGVGTLYLNGFCLLKDSSYVSLRWNPSDNVKERHLVLEGENYISNNFYLDASNSKKSVNLIIEGEGKLFMGKEKEQTTFMNGNAWAYKGAMFIEGDAELNITGTYTRGLISTGSLVISENGKIKLKYENNSNAVIESADSANNAFSISDGNVYKDEKFYNQLDEKVFEVTLSAASKSFRVIKDSIDDIQQPIDIGTNVNLNFEIKQSGYGENISYQWYQSNTIKKSNPKPIVNETSTSYNFSSSKPGVFYLYCVARCGELVQESTVREVVVRSGNVVNTNIIINDLTESIDHLTDLGYKYDASKKELILKDVTIINAKIGIKASSPVTIIIEGNNFMYATSSFSYNQIEIESDVDIVGKNNATLVLNGDSSNNISCKGGNLKIKDLNLEAINKNEIGINNTSSGNISIINSKLFINSNMKCLASAKGLIIENSTLDLESAIAHCINVNGYFDFKDSDIKLKSSTGSGIWAYTNGEKDININNCDLDIESAKQAIYHSSSNDSDINFTIRDSELDLKTSSTNAYLMQMYYCKSLNIINSDIEFESNYSDFVFVANSFAESISEIINMVSAEYDNIKVSKINNYLSSNDVSAPYKGEIDAKDEAYLEFVDIPAKKEVFVNSLGAKGQTLNAKAVVKNGKASSSITYKWYETTNIENINSADDKLVSSKNTFTIPTSERGGKYYYCVASTKVGSKVISTTSNLFCVVIGAKGKLPVTKSLSFDKDKSVDELDTYGYSWNHETKTLMFDNYEGFYPFSRNFASQGLILGLTGIDVTINLTNNSINRFTSEAFAFDTNYNYGDGFTWTVSGNGTIDTGDSDTFWAPWYKHTLVLNQGVKFYGTDIFGNVVLNGGKLYMDNLTIGHSSYNCSLTMNENSVVECDSLTVNGDVTVNDSKLTVFRNNGLANVYGNLTLDNSELLLNGNRGTRALSVSGNTNLTGTSSIISNGSINVNGTNSGRSFTIGENSSVDVYSESVGIGFDSANAIFNVNGKLAISCGKKQTNDYYAIKFYNNGTLNLGDNVIQHPSDISTSEDLMTWITTHSSVDNSTVVISKTPIEKVNLESVSIKGVAQAGETLTASSLKPTGAIVKYQWQYSNDGITFKNISNQNNDTYKIESRYSGKYIRLVATGVLYNQGSVSNTIGPVKANLNELKAIYLDGTIKSEDGNYTTSNKVSNMFTSYIYNDKTRIVVEKNSDNAIVTIKNITTDTIHNGNDAEVSLNSGKNDLLVTYTYNGHVNEYKFTIYRYDFDTRTEFITNDDNIVCTLKYIDEKGSEVVKVLDGESLTFYPKKNSEVTILAKCEKENMVFNFDEMIKDGFEKRIFEDGSEGVKFSYVASKTYYTRFDNLKYYQVAKPNVKVTWINDMNLGLQLYAEWEKEYKFTNGYSGSYIIAELYEVDSKGNVLPTNIVASDAYNLEEDSTLRKGFNLASLFVENYGEPNQYNRYEGRIGSDLDANKEYELHLYYYSPGVISPYNKGQAYIERFKASQSGASINIEKNNVLLIRKNTDVEYEFDVEFTNISKMEKGFTGITTNCDEHLSTLETSTSDYVYFDNDKIHVYIQSSNDCSYEGSNYVTVALTDCLGNTLSDSLKVTVANQETSASAITLKQNTGTINLFSNDELTIPVSVTSTGYSEITEAKAVITNGQKSLTSKVYRDIDDYINLEVKDGNTIVVTPIIPEDSDSYNWTDFYKMFSGKYEFYIKVKTNRNDILYSNETYKLTVSNKVPTVKMPTLSFNGFYKEDSKNVGVEISGYNIEKISVDRSTETAKQPAIPIWLTYDEQNSKLTCNSSLLQAKGKNSGKVFYKIFVEGCECPILTSQIVNASVTEYKMKVNNPTITLFERADDNKYIYLVFSVNAKNIDTKKDSFKVSIVNNGEIAAMSEKEKAKYKIQDLLKIYSQNYDENTGLCEVKLALNKDYTKAASGTILFDCMFDNSNSKVRVPVTVKTLNKEKATFTASVKDIKINQYLGRGNDVRNVTFKSNVNSFDIDSITYKVVRADQPKVEVPSELNVIKSGNGFNISSNNSTVLAMKYTVTFTDSITGKTAPVTVSFVNNAPIIKLAKPSLTLNTTDEYVTTTITSADTNYDLYSRTDSAYDSDRYLIKVTAPNKQVYEGSDLNYSGLNIFLTDLEKANEIKIASNASLQIGKYSISLTYLYKDNCQSKPVVLTLNVSDKAPAFKLDKATITLNKEFKENGDVAVIKLSEFDKLSDYSCKIVDSKGVESTKLNVSTSRLESYGEFTVGLSNSVAYGDTYKVLITPKYGIKETKAKDLTLTVKVAPQDKKLGVTKFDYSLKTNGYIDLTRALETGVEVTSVYTNWNATSSPTSPVVTWKIIAKEGSKLYNKNGIVDGVVSNWFEVVDTPMYGLNVKVDTSSSAYTNGYISPQLKYSLVVTYTTDESSGYGKQYFTKEIVLPVKQGKVNFACDKKEIVLSKSNGNDSEIVVIKKTDSDRKNVNKVNTIEVTGSTIFDANIVSNLDYLVSKSIDGCIYISVGYKNSTLPSKPTNGSIKINIYLEGNNVSNGKPDATIPLKVNVK